MQLVVHPAAIHPLTPGSPAYALLKVSAIGSIFALRFALTRRNRDHEGAAPERAAVAESAPEAQPQRTRSQHPVSRKKKRRRRR
jgi:hypothetical protein